MFVEILPSKYPQARRDDSIVDNLHGTKVADPYRWLEDPDAEETRSFVTELNKVSEPYIKQSGVCESLEKRLTKLWDYEKYGSKSKHGDHYYVFYNTGIQNQSVIYQSDSYKTKGKVFFDVNQMSSDGTTAISSYSWTDDGQLLAISFADKGSDVNYTRFFDETGKQLSDTIMNIKFSGIHWLLSKEGVIYSTYPGLRQLADKALVKEELNHSLYYHKMGTDSSDDLMIVDFPDRPKDSVSGGITEDGSFLVVSTTENCGATNCLYYYDLDAADGKIAGKLQVKPLFEDNQNRYDFIINVGKDKALIITNHEAPMCKLVKVDLASAADSSKWEELLEHDSKRLLEYVVPFANDKFLALYLEDVHHVLQVHDLASGKKLQNIDLPIGTVSSIHARLKRTEVFFAFESILNPPSYYRFDYAEVQETNKINLELVHQSRIQGFDPDEFETKQIFFPSKDGTRVPMFITAKKGVQLNNQNPTLLYGYGGFDVTINPYFSISRIHWLKSGGVHALANLRGGGEYGEKWHKSGTLEKKQNVFDDFHAAAEYLTKANSYSNREKLVIQGGSNGGLLVAACAQQRPDLYGCVIGQVGVLDMLRFHKFTIGHAWTSDFGDPDNAEHFKFIYKYSPLHNISAHAKYQWPAMLMLTADHDDRVVPAHTLKYMAQLYYVIAKDAANTQRQPLLASIDVNAGHGAGKPTTKIIEELAKIYAFIHRALDIPYKDQ